MKEEPELRSRRRGKHLEVTRGRPAAAVCGEGGGQHGDARRGARGDLRRCGEFKSEREKKERAKSP